MSSENVALVVADSWEDADADPVKELMDKMEKVKILQRKEQKKEQFFEKIKAEESVGALPKLQAEEGSASGPVAEEPKRIMLRRPKDGFNAETVAETNPSSGGDSSPQNQDNADRGRNQYKNNQNKEKKPNQTFEQRQAAYQAARERILGSEYKPDNQEIKELKFVDRSKSPETLRMTQQNMVEHYGEELSRELMQQPTDHVEAQKPEIPQFVPDFSLQQPPPNMLPIDGGAPASEVYNGPPGFPQSMPPHPLQQQNYQPQQQQYMEFPPQYYIQMDNRQMLAGHFAAQGNQVENQKEQQQQHQHQQTVYFYPPAAHPQQVQQQVQNQMFQNYAQYQQQQQQQQLPQLPNMAFPPPNFVPQQHQLQQQQQNSNIQQQQNIHGNISNQQQQQQMMHLQQQQQHQYYSAPPQNQMNRGQRGPNQNQRASQPAQFSTLDGTNGPVPLMQANTMGKNGGRFQPQNGQGYIPMQNNQNRKGNGGKNAQGAAKNYQQPPQIPVDFSVPPPPLQPGQNPIPFGCPPPHVSAIREQYMKPPNSGAGLLGAHPMMQWNGPPAQQNRQQQQ